MSKASFNSSGCLLNKAFLSLIFVKVFSLSINFLAGLNNLDAKIGDLPSDTNSITVSNAGFPSNSLFKNLVFAWLVAALPNSCFIAFNLGFNWSFILSSLPSGKVLLLTKSFHTSKLKGCLTCSVKPCFDLPNFASVLISDSL